MAKYLEVLVDHNSVVQAGDVIVRLRNRDLEIQIADLVGQFGTTAAELTRVDGQLRYAQSLSPVEKRALEGEKIELLQQVKVIEQKEALLASRKQQLDVLAPISGTVTSWDVEKTLHSRPIMTGQVLMEIADLDQDFFLDLELPEKREGHLDEYVSKNDSTQLDVSYILATDPDNDLKAELQLASVSERAEPNEEHGAVIKMHALPVQDTLRKLRPRPGSKVIAKIHCGRASCGFVFFHEILEWCHKFFF